LHLQVEIPKSIRKKMLPEWREMLKAEPGERLSRLELPAELVLDDVCPALGLADSVPRWPEPCRAAAVGGASATYQLGLVLLATPLVEIPGCH
jgi:hypothetical protein